MTKNRTFWGVALIVAAVAMLLDGAGVMHTLWSDLGGLSLLRLIVGVILLARMIYCWMNRWFREPVWELAALFMLFEKNVAYVCGREDPNLVSNWLILLCALLITVGISLILPKSLKKPVERAVTEAVSSSSYGSTQVRVDCRNFTYQLVENDMGATTVYFDNPEAYVGDAVLEIVNHMGAVTVLVPSSFRVEMTIANHLGNIQGPAPVHGDGPLVTVSGSNELGAVIVKRA